MIVLPVLVIEGCQSRERGFSQVGMEPSVGTSPANPVVLPTRICVREETIVGKDEADRCGKRGLSKGVNGRI